MKSGDLSSQLQFSISRRFEPFYSGGRVAVSRDGSLLFCTHCNVVRAVEVESVSIRFTVGDPETDSPLTSFSLNENCSRLVVAHENLLLKIWLVTSNGAAVEKIWKIGGKGPVQQICQDARGLLLATGASDGTVKLWNLQTQNCVGSVRSESGLITSLCLAPSSSGDGLFFGTDTGAICYWHNSETTQLRFHSSCVTCLCLADDVLYSASRDMTIALWDLSGLRVKRSIPCFEAVECLLPTSKALVIAGDKGQLSFVQPSIGKVTASQCSLGSRIVSLQHCAALSSYLVVTENENVHLVSEDTLTIRKHLVGNRSIVNDVAFVSKEQVAVATNSSEIRLYNVATGDCKLLLGHQDIVLSVASPSWSDSILMSSSKDNTARLWRLFDSDDVRCICIASGHTANVGTVQFSNRKADFCVTASEDRTIKLFQMQDSWLSSDEWKERAPEEMSALLTKVAHANSVSCLAVSPNDRLLASGSMDKTVKVWNVESSGRSLKLAGTIDSHARGVWDVRFSPVDQVIASASGDCLVKLFSLQTLNCLRTFEGHSSAVFRVLFFPRDAAHLLSSDGSGLLKLWEVKTSACVNTYDAHEGKVWAVALREDGKKLITAGEDGVILLWDDVTAERAQECERLRQKALYQDQALTNLIRQQEYVKALRLSLQLKRPKASFDLLTRMLLRDEGVERTKADVAQLSLEEWQVILPFTVDWNASSRTYYPAHLVISVLLDKYSLKEILKWPNVASLVRDLIPYTIRHFERLSGYREKMALVSFIINSSNLAADAPLENGSK